MGRAPLRESRSRHAAPVRGPAAASPLPLIVGLAAVVVSIGIAVYVIVAQSAPVPDLSEPPARDEPARGG